MIRAHFDWDPNKDLENQEEHGVSFRDAQYAFADPQRVLALDASHATASARLAAEFSYQFAFQNVIFESVPIAFPGSLLRSERHSLTALRRPPGSAHRKAHILNRESVS